MKSPIYTWIAAALMFVVSGVAQSGKEFSATMVQTTQTGKTVEKLSIGSGKLRIEPQGAVLDSPIVVVDINGGTSYMLMPSQKTFIEVKGVQADTIHRMPFLSPVDPQHPCNALLGAGTHGDAKLSCRDGGRSEVNGRAARKWVAVLSGGKEGYVWIDAKLSIITRMESPDGTLELQDIREGQQAPSLFEIPQDYSRVRLGADAER